MIDRLADGIAARVEMAPGEIARTIETNGCWMVLGNIEQVTDCPASCSTRSRP